MNRLNLLETFAIDFGVAAMSAGPENAHPRSRNHGERTPVALST